MIKRYRHWLGEEARHMVETFDGEYVLYEDHLAAIAEKDKEIERTKSDCMTLTLRLYGEPLGSMSPETIEVMGRWKPEDSNLLKHAKRELQFAGYDLNQEEEDPNKWMVGDVLELLTVFAKQGHSGFSAPYCIKYFKKLANFEPLTPLQGTDDEWNSLTSLDETFQNVRCSKIFKSKNGVSYTIDGYVFWHWSERPLYEYEVGYPGTTRYKSCFKSNMSRKLIKFPYIPEKPEYIEVDSFEVNKETEEREPGSGWWKTIYPENIIEENSKLTKMLEKEK